jgi:hypothetical protein
MHMYCGVAQHRSQFEPGGDESEAQQSPWQFGQLQASTARGARATMMTAVDAPRDAANATARNANEKR